KPRLAGRTEERLPTPEHNVRRRCAVDYIRVEEREACPAPESPRWRHFQAPLKPPRAGQTDVEVRRLERGWIRGAQTDEVPVAVVEPDDVDLGAIVRQTLP